MTLSQTSHASTEGNVASAHAPVGLVLRMVLLVILLTAAAIAGVLMLVNRIDWWRGFSAATVITLMASAFSVPAIAWGIRAARMKPEMAMAGYFIAAGIRATISLGGAALAVWVGGYPKTPTFLLVVPFYFSLLAVETVLMARALWRPTAGPGSTENQHA